MTKRDAPATYRNRDAILSVLARWLESPARVLEVASGTGQHAVYFAEKLPHLQWHPSDTDPERLASIEAWRAESGLPNLAPAILLDAADASWPKSASGPFDACFNANMIHISPWNVAEGLFAGVAQSLCERGLLFLYGPFRIGGEHTSPSNAAFDADLKARDPSWGVRDLEKVEALGAAQGVLLEEKNEMPANNWMLVFRKI
ncbi:MAG: DUF938 domain-containing protein [Myxococcota bacterium]